MPKYSGDIKQLDSYLLDHSYVDGYTPTNLDAEAFAAVSEADAKGHANVVRWRAHISSFSAAEQSAWTAGVAAAAAPAAAAAEEEEFDLFAEEDEEAEAAREAEIQRRADEQIAKKKAQNEAAGKVVVMKSVVIFDVKPYDDETDLLALEKKIRETVEMPGLEWKAGELKEIAFGLKKLAIMAHIVDDLVMTDDIVDKIQAFEDEVQSVDIAAFSKL